MSLVQSNTRTYTVDSGYKPRKLTRKDKIERSKSRYAFDKKTYGEPFANQCLMASCKDEFPDEPLNDSEIVYIKNEPVKPNLQADVRRDSGKLIDSYTRQQEDRSKGATKAKKQPMLEPKPSSQFITKAEPGSDNQNDAEIDEMLNEKMKHLKKRIKGQEW